MLAERLPRWLDAALSGLEDFILHDVREVVGAREVVQNHAADSRGLSGTRRLIQPLELLERHKVADVVVVRRKGIERDLDH